MTWPLKLRWGCFFILTLPVISALQGCFPTAKDPFTITAKDVNQDIKISDVGYMDDGYEWGFGLLGSVLGAHGLPDSRRTFVITHRAVDGKTEVVWPVFIYGDSQANVEVMDHICVFTAMLPDKSPVLMAHRAGQPATVISPGVLRLAAQRLGTTVIVPGTGYYFTKVRQPPDRIWLKGQPISSANLYPPQGTFTLELTAADLNQLVDDARSQGTLRKAGQFEYLATTGSLTQISQQETATVTNTALPPAKSLHKTMGYVPRNEELIGNALLDAANHYAYFSTSHEPGRILKVALGSDARTLPTVIGTAVLDGEEDKPFNSVIDTEGGQAYFGTDFPGHLVKVALGDSNAPPYRVGSALVDNDTKVGAGVLDAARGIACFQVGHRLVKFKLGKGEAAPVVVSQVDFPPAAGNVSFTSGVLDPTTHDAYFGSDGVMIYKVAIGEGDAPPKFTGSLKLADNEFGLRGALIDPTNGTACFTSQTGSLIKISLGTGDDPPRRLGALKLGAKHQYSDPTFGRDNADYAYIGSGSGEKTGDAECCDGGVLKVALGAGADLPRVVSFMPLADDINIAEGVVDADHRTLYLGVTEAGLGCKILMLNLGDGDAPPTIIGETKLYLK